MKIVRGFFLVAMAIFSISVFAQQKKIAWSEKPLSWDDFQAKADASSNYSANLNSGISYSWTFSTASGKPVLIYEVTSSFYPDLSWKKQQINDPNYLLEHEQTHFNISELHARKLRKALANYEVGRSVRQDLKKIYQDIEAERVEMQHQFDEETSHSEKRLIEMEWRKYVAEELKKLQQYSA